MCSLIVSVRPMTHACLILRRYSLVIVALWSSARVLMIKTSGWVPLEALRVCAIHIGMLRGLLLYDEVFEHCSLFKLHLQKQLRE